MCLPKKPKAPKPSPAQAAQPPVLEAPTLLGAADSVAAQNPLFSLPSTILSGAEFDYVRQQNANRARAVQDAAAQDSADLAKKKKATTTAVPGAAAAGQAAARKKKPIDEDFLAYGRFDR